MASNLTDMAPGSTWMPTLTAVNQGRTIRGGRRSLIEFWQKQQEAGVSHVMLNVKPTRRTTKEIFEELGTHVLPLFPAQAEPAQVGRA